MHLSLQLFRLSVAVLLSICLYIQSQLHLNLRLRPLLCSEALHKSPSGSTFLLRFLLDKILTVQQEIEGSAPPKLRPSFWGECCGGSKTT